MVSKIDGVSGQQSPVHGAKESARPERNEGERSAGTPSTSDQLSLTSSAQLLKELSEAVEFSTGMDRDRIEAIRKALEDGTYEVDAARIADKLLKLEEQL